MARMVSCGSPCSWVQMVREYWVRLLRGSSASAPDAIQAASANIAAMRFPTDSSIKPGTDGTFSSFTYISHFENWKTFRLSPVLISLDKFP